MLKYSIEQINKIRVLLFEGQISYMENEILKIIVTKEKEMKEVDYILDLSNVFYIDSYGISFLQNIILGSQNKRNLVIVSDRDYTAYIIRFNKLDKFYNVQVAKTIEEAIALCNN